MPQTARGIFNAIFKIVKRMGDKDAALDSIRTYYVKNNINKSKRDEVYQYSRETKHRMRPTRWIILLLREAVEELKAVPAASSRSSSPDSMSSGVTFAAAAAAPTPAQRRSAADPYGLGPAKFTPQSKSSSSGSDSDAGHYKRTNTKHKRNKKSRRKSTKIRKKVKGKSKKIRRKVKGKSKKIRFRK